MRSGLTYVAVVLLVSCSYPLDPDHARGEVFGYANRVERILPSSWKIFKDYNPYGFGMILVRTQDNAQFVRLPSGQTGYLELVVYLSANENIRSTKISEPEFEERESTRRKIIARQQQVYKSLYPRATQPVSYLEYLPVTIEKEQEITEYNKLVDEMRTNEKHFPRHFTESFGVEFVYPEPYQISGVPESLKREFLEVVEKVKKVFPQYNFP